MKRFAKTTMMMHQKAFQERDHSSNMPRLSGSSTKLWVTCMVSGLITDLSKNNQSNVHYKACMHGKYQIIAFNSFLQLTYDKI